MKRIHNKFNKIISIPELIDAFYHVKKVKKRRSGLKNSYKYEMNLAYNILTLHNKLKNGRIKKVNYNTFIIYENKARVIHAPDIESAIIQQAIYSNIKDAIDKKFIKNSHACRIGGGIQKSRDAIKNMLGKSCIDSYYIQMDIQKFFYSIDPKILMSILTKRYIKDVRLLDLIEVFLKSPNSDIGIPIGNVLSQIFANIYMTEVDRYLIKKYTNKYVRYMDDFILIGLSLEEAKAVLEDTCSFIDKELNLSLSKYTINKIKRGTNFAGYRVWKHKILLRKRHIRNANKFLKDSKRESYISILGLSKGTSAHSYILNLESKYK